MSAARALGDEKAVRKYLAQHAEPEIRIADAWSGTMTWDAVIAVPLHAESSSFLDGYRAAFAESGGRVLCIAVVNGRAQDSEPARAANRGLLCALSDQAEPLAREDSVAWLRHHADFDLLCIDRTSSGRELPDDQGVGLARKIAADLALALCAANAVRRPWIYCSDADVRLPVDYFRRAVPPAAAALAFPFWHVASGDARIDRATALYEASLRYWVLGLHHAESPYAHQCVGSTLALDASAYARVRGFPRRRAGEDFYLMNKLAKQGDIRVPEGEPIEIRGRISTRVPFGTGAATARIASELDSDRRFMVYAPETFTLLGIWLAALAEHIDPGAAHEPARSQGERRELSEWNPEELLERTKRSAQRSMDADAAQRLERAIVTSGVLQGVTEAARRVPPAQRLWRAHEWFDAFRTLKLIHVLRDDGFPNVPFEQAMARAPFCGEWGAHCANDLGDLRDLRRNMQQREPTRSGLSAATRRGSSSRSDSDPENDDV